MEAMNQRLSLLVAVSALLLGSPAYAALGSIDAPERAKTEQSQRAPADDASQFVVPLEKNGLQADRPTRKPFEFRPAHPSDELQRFPSTVPSLQKIEKQKVIDTLRG
jgi:hypothetical protein